MQRTFLGLLLSVVGHGVIFLAVSAVSVSPKPEKVIQKVIVRDIPKPPPPAPPPVVEKKEQPPPPPPPKPLKERKPRVREDKRTPPVEAPVQEIRAGLSDSVAAPGKSSGPAIAQGNTAEAAVDPAAANRPPPPPVAVSTEPPPDPNSAPVSEAAADTPAKCSSLGEIQISDDAVNAGITSGKVIVEAVIGFDGKVIKATLKKGTGYQVDNLVVDRILKLRCAPAKQGGKDVAMRWRIEIPISL